MYEPVTTNTDAAPAQPRQTGWQSLPPIAAKLATVSGGLWGLLVGSGVAATSWTLQARLSSLDGGAAIAIPALLALACALLGAALGYRRWKFSRWMLDDTGLHVQRGRYWRKEILVPRSRVQHLDIERGPIERHFRLATLIVHTAGTRHHALRQSGFLDADAVSLRDALVPASGRHDDVL